MNLVFFGTSNVALPVLEQLHTHHTIKAVVTAPDALVGRKQTLSPSPVALLATELQIPLILKPQSVRNNVELLEELRRLNADIFIVVSYGKIMPPELINLPPWKTLNIHFSRLPQYRGASPIQAALLNGDATTATTIFILDELLDHGPIIAQEEAVIEADDTFLTLSQRLAHQSAHLLIKILPDYAAGKITPQPQDHEKATTCKTISRQDGQINWNETATQIYNRFRAFYPWPGIWTTWNKKIVKILDCLPAVNSANQPAGTVLSDGSVACGGNTVLGLLTIQLEGKSPTAVPDFLRGYPSFNDSVLI